VDPGLPCAQATVRAGIWLADNWQPLQSTIRNEGDPLAREQIDPDTVVMTVMVPVLIVIAFLPASAKAKVAYSISTIN